MNISTISSESKTRLQILKRLKCSNELSRLIKVKKIKFAELIDYENTNLHAVLKGRRRLNNKLATKIGSIFSIDPQLWMFIDTKNELTKYQMEHKTSKKKYSLDKLKYAR